MRLGVPILFLFPAAISLAQSPFALQKTANRATADLYLSGSYTGAIGEDTQYAFDIKLRYPRFFERLNPGATGDRQYLSFSPLAEFLTNKGTRASPDRIRLGLDLTYLVDANPGGQIRPTVTGRQWVTQPAGEFDRKFDTRSFVTTSFHRWIFRSFNTLDANGSVKGPLKLGFTPTIEAGVEAGYNFRNRLSQKLPNGDLTPGSGAIARIYGGFTAEQQLFTRQVVLLATYQYRGPLRQEAFTYRPRKKPGEARKNPIDILTAKPRHYLEVGLAFPLSNLWSIKPAYKWGSLPPSYNFLDHQFQIAIEMKGQVPVRN